MSEDFETLELVAEDDVPEKKIGNVANYIKQLLVKEAEKYEEEQETFEGEKPLDELQVFSACAGILSQEYVNSLPTSLHIFLKDFGRKHRVGYNKIGDHIFFFGKGRSLFRAYEGLPNLVKRYRESMEAKKTPKVKPKIAPRPKVTPRYPKKKFMPLPSEVVPDVHTPDGRRASSRLQEKPRRSYSALNAGDTPGPSQSLKPDKKPEKSDRKLDKSEKTPKNAKEIKKSAKIVQVFKDVESHDDYFVMEVDESDDEEWLNEDTTFDEDDSATTGAGAEPYLDSVTGDWVTPAERGAKQNDTSATRAIETQATGRSLIKPSYVKLEKEERHVKVVPSSVVEETRKRGRPRKSETNIKMSPSSNVTPTRKRGRPSKSTSEDTPEAEPKRPLSERMDRAAKNLHPCDICYRGFRFENLLRRHRETHFGADGSLETSAIAIHLQALETAGREENLTGDLRRQIQEYRLRGDVKSEPQASTSDWPQSVGVVVKDIAESDATNLGKTQRGRKPNSQRGPPAKEESATANEGEGKSGSYPCDQCCCKMTSQKSLNQHKKSVHGKVKKLSDDQNTPLQCPHCDFVCNRMQNFTRHVKSHSNAALYTCNLCSYSHKERSEVMRHQRNAHQQKIHQCPECPSKHRNKNLLQLHIKSKHRKAYSMVCDICGQKLLNKVSYRAHMRRHEDQEEGGTTKTQVMCNMCARVLPSKSSFDKHLQKFHSNDNGSDEMQQVNEGVIILDDGQFQCKYCSTYINQMAREVRRHILRKHMEKTHKCDQCKSAFPLETLLQKHIRVVHYGLEKKKCPECNKWFRNNAFLTAHMKRAHSGELQCGICQKFFCDKRTLLTHSEIHKPPEERTYPFSCELCNKKFRFLNSYEQHMMTHSGDRPFVCTICRDSFVTKGTLETHMSKHSEERPFACSFCEKRFKLKKYLDVHLLIHSGNKFTCSLCHKVFGNAEAQEKHTCKAMVIGQATMVPGYQIVQDVDMAQLENIGDQVAQANQGVLIHLDDENKEVSEGLLYMCSTCDAGFQDIKSASQHVCPGKTGDGTSLLAINGQEQGAGELTAPADHQSYSVLPVDPTQPQLDLASTAEYALDMVPTCEDNTLAVATAISLSSQVTSILSDPSTSTVQISLSDPGTSQYNDATLTNISNIPEVTTGGHAAETPMEMYMCGICNSLFVTPEDVQDHMQVHGQEITAALGGDGVELEAGLPVVIAADQSDQTEGAQ